MGCIEIHLKTPNEYVCLLFNSNMGCIEIHKFLESITKSSWFNSNMGCIEITPLFFISIDLYRLTVTWDVLKSS